MALSGREVLLVLRARDEATRTIGRVSGAMRRMDKNALASSVSMVNGQKTALRQLQHQLGDVNYAYRETSATALERHRAEMRNSTARLAAIRDQEREIRRLGGEQMRYYSDLRKAEGANKAMADEGYRSAKAQMQQQLDDLYREQQAIENVRRTSRSRYQEQIEGARRLHINQQEQIRQSRIAAQEAIVQHNERIAMIKDEQDRRRQAGNMMMGLSAGAVAAGAAMTYAGVQGVQAWASNVSVLAEYEQQARRTLTQIDTFKASLQQVKDLGEEVAETVPVAFEEIQPALYDIFSSIDVGLGGARKLIKQFAQDAVGGQATMETATRANLQIMNAYKVSVKDAADVSDFMFQLVRKGVGTYDEFAKTIGRAIPSAVRAGQSYETLGGMMAFMTRNGLSAAMAGTSAARALDAISHVKTVEKLHDLGIEAKNAKGEFRPLVDILADMNKKFGDMTAPERSEALYELFKSSGGTIQARRFFDSYFKNVDEFEQRTKEMQNSAGAAGEAFKIMAESPQAAIERAKNAWTLLRLELAENLMPVVLFLVEKFTQLVTWFRNLSPETRRAITYVAAFGSALLIVVGIFTIILGAIGLFVGAIASLGIGLGAAMGIFAGVTAVLVALGAVAYYVYKHWDKFKPMFDKVKGWAGDFKDWIQNSFIPGLQAAWEKGKEYARRFKEWFETKLLPGLKEAYSDLKDKIETALDDIAEAWEQFKKDVDWEDIASDIEDVKNQIDSTAPEIVRIIQWMGAMIGIQMIGIGTAFQIVAPALAAVLNTVSAVASEFVQGFIMIFRGIIQFIHGDITAAMGFLEGDWGKMCKGMGEMASGLKDAVIGAFKILVKVPVRIISGMVDAVIGLFEGLYDVLVGHSIVPDLIDEIVRLFLSLPSRTMGAVKGWVGDMISQAADLANRFGKKIATMITSAITAVKSLRTKARGAVGDLGGLLYSKGTSLVQGFIDGIQDRYDSLMSWISRVKNAASNAGGGWAGSALGALGAGGTAIGLGLGLGEKVIAGQKPKKLSWIDHMKKELKGVKLEKELKPLYKDIYATLIKDMADEMPKMAGVLDTARPLIAKKLNAIAKGLKGDAKKAFDKSRGARTKGLLHQVAEATERDLKRLQTATKKYQDIMKKLEKARDKLQERKSIKASFIESTSSMLKDFASFSSFETPTDVFGNEEPVTLDYIKTQVASKLAVIKQFGRNLKKLLKAGYSKAIYQMVIALGPEAGNLYAEALLAATPDEIKELNQMVGQTNDMADMIAEAAGSKLYDAGIKAAQGLVDGLAAKAKDLREIAKRLGIMIAEEIKKALKKGSAEKEGADHAKKLADGMMGQKEKVAAAAKALADAAKVNWTDGSDTVVTPKDPPKPPPPPGGWGGSGGPPPETGGRPILKQEITVNTQEIDPVRHAKQLGWELAANYRL